MIINYSDDFFVYLSDNVHDFSVEYLKKGNTFLKNYIYVVDDIPVALISYSLIYDRIELEYIWVKENYRCMGIASKLMDRMFEEKYSNITLEVRKSNFSAINLYKKYGFKVASIRYRYYGDEDAYLMIREMM